MPIGIPTSVRHTMTATMGTTTRATAPISNAVPYLAEVSTMLRNGRGNTKKMTSPNTKAAAHFKTPMRYVSPDCHLGVSSLM